MSNFKLAIVAVGACLLTVTWFIDDSVTTFSAEQLQIPARVSKWIAQFHNGEQQAESSTVARKRYKFMSSENSSTSDLSFAVMGATTNPIYLFPLPITVLAWRRINVDSIICFAGDEETFMSSPATKIVMEFLKDLEVQWIFLDSKKAPLHTISQTCRMYIASSPDVEVPDDSIIITTDSDIWLFHKENHVPKPPKKMHLYNSECCGITYKQSHPNNKYRMYPMTSMGMSATMWMELMNVTRGFLTNGDVLAERLYSEFENIPYIRDGKGKPDLSDSWYADQVLTSEKIDWWIKKNPGNINLVSKTPYVVGRIDRSYWTGDRDDIDISKHMDSHILHPLHETDNWSRTLPLLRAMLTKDEIKRIEEYWKQFTEALKKEESEKSTITKSSNSK